MHIHILGICGTFMAGIARIAVQLGHRVTGADRQVYPPMSTQLEQLGIAVHPGYGAESLDAHPDVVVVGNALTRGMPIIERLLNDSVPYVSGPAWLKAEVLSHRHVLAVSGTHGKTTTTGMLAWILESKGLDPGFLVGGVPGNFDVSARLGSGDHFVIEADEYDTAFFDKRAKFVHYPARTLVINNLEHDHADIYPDVTDIERQFHHLVRQTPGRAAIIAGASEPHIERVLDMGCWTPVSRFGVGEGDWQARLRSDDGGAFQVLLNGNVLGEVEWGCFGLYNVRNALAAIAAANHVGIDAGQSAMALTTFRPPARRQELVFEHNGVHTYLDFAHHPTAIKLTLESMRAHHAGRILAVLEPRSNTMRAGTHVDALRDALTRADLMFVLADVDLNWDARAALTHLGEQLCVATDPDTLMARVGAAVRPGDVVVIMSNGDGARLATRLRTIVQAPSNMPEDS
jgi:UDP-N-acetylmuramate: L-alanyl-gamma-D-glutamyl-meso-diaminopimelate ligase